MNTHFKLLPTVKFKGYNLTIGLYEQYKIV